MDLVIVTIAKQIHLYIDTIPLHCIFEPNPRNFDEIDTPFFVTHPAQAAPSLDISSLEAAINAQGRN